MAGAIRTTAGCRGGDRGGGSPQAEAATPCQLSPRTSRVTLPPCTVFPRQQTVLTGVPAGLCCPPGGVLTAGPDAASAQLSGGPTRFRWPPTSQGPWCGEGRGGCPSDAGASARLVQPEPCRHVSASSCRWETRHSTCRKQTSSFRSPRTAAPGGRRPRGSGGCCVPRKVPRVAAPEPLLAWRRRPAGEGAPQSGPVSWAAGPLRCHGGRVGERRALLWWGESQHCGEGGRTPVDRGAGGRPQARGGEGEAAGAAWRRWCRARGRSRLARGRLRAVGVLASRGWDQAAVTRGAGPVVGSPLSGRLACQDVYR